MRMNIDQFLTFVINTSIMKSIKQIALFLLLAPFFTSCGYNDLVNLDEDSDRAWANVEDAYKRRADLIPNLQNIVKGSADFEKETLESVIEARAKATSVNVDPSNATPEQMAEFLKAQDGLGSALSRLLVTVERYPELKSTAGFLDFQTQLESTENRISKARRDFNDTIGKYNSFRRQFPNVFYAGMLGFKDKAYFEAPEEDLKTPDIEFDFGTE